MKTAVILGAGFSAAAGLPLTQHLLGRNPMALQSNGSTLERLNAEAIDAFERWHASNPEGQVEEWFRVLYDGRNDPEQERLQGTTWSKTIRYALSRLAPIGKSKVAPYYYSIARYQCAKVHRAFWDRMEQEWNARVIVSLNYDILAERALHDTSATGATKLLFRYGGMPYNMKARKMTDVYQEEATEVPFGDHYVLYKLHGSISWAWEKHSTAMKVHGDVRAVFRTSRRVGEPAIIPPIPEKQRPSDFATIWERAKEDLAKHQRWVVCGYSLPVYDHEVRGLFSSALASVTPPGGREIIVMDPDSEALLQRWREFAPSGTRLRALPGLPAVLDQAWAAGGAE
jgi:hypothetical protein